MTPRKLPTRDDIDRASREEAGRHIEQLRQEIRHHDYLYYVKNQPVIPDEDYDRLFETLKRFEARFPDLVTPDSPTQRVGGEPLEEFPTVAHTVSMLSLDATREEKDLRLFDERIRKAVGEHRRYVLEEKLDGVSIELVYVNGVLDRGVTRGNGREGEGVTENVKTIRSVPLRLRSDQRAVPAFLAVRGEVMINISAFEQVNRALIERGSEPFANPRNAAAGSLRQLDPRVTADRPLELIGYEVLAVEGESFDTDSEALQALMEWGIRIPQTRPVVETVEEILTHHQRWTEARDRLDYEIDGVVIKLEDLEGRKKLGYTTHHPRWALAYKFPPRLEVTRIEDIAVQVGRTGLLTPVALMRPVEVGGVTVSRASLHNREEVQRKDVRVGDLIRVQRAGDVIPEVVERVPEPGVTRGAPFAIPTTCPSCGSAVIHKGPYTICPNRFGCREQLKGHVEHFASKQALDIEHLGGETVSALVDQGFVTGLADLFRLKKEDLLQLERFAEVSAKKLVRSIQSRKRVELRRFLHGLGIPEVGTAVARDLADHFQSLEAIRKASRAQLEEVPRIGPKMSEAIHDFFQEPRNQRQIDELLHVGVKVIEPSAGEQQSLADTKFVLTGSLDRFSRSEAKELIESLGGRAMSSVSRETDYVVVGKDPGSKLEDARANHVDTLDEQEFIRLLRKAGAKL